MAKEDKYLIAQWVETNPGGGVSLAGMFVEYVSTTVELANGRTKRIPADKPTSLTVKAVCGDDGEVVDYKGEKIELMQGEFIVPNNSDNVKMLKRMCKMDMIMMRDEDLHEEFINNTPLVTPPKVEKTPEPVAVEVTEPKEKSELEAITCLKINRDKVFEQLEDLGKGSLEEVSQMTKEQLTLIKGIGDKMAEAMLEEAKALCE